MACRYIFEGQGGDQFVGRAATGLNLNDSRFACLPPHFDFSGGPVLSLAEWEDILPGYSTFYPAEFRAAIPFLLASIIFHRQWLRANLSAQHPIFYSRIFTSGITTKLCEKIQAGIFKNDLTGMIASGIPQHVKLLHRFDELDKQMETVKTRIDALEECMVRAFEDVPQKVVACMLEHCQVNGAVPISRSDIKDMFATFRSEIVDTVARGLRNETISSVQQIEEVVESVQFPTWTWGGRLHMVPQG